MEQQSCHTNKSENNIEIKIDHINHQLTISKNNEFVIKVFNTDQDPLINERILNILKCMGCNYY